MLEVRGISRSFGNHLIVNDISFSVASGTILALLGPNGCGKSTTLKVLSGALPPTAGEYWIDGHAGRSDPARRATGYVPDTRGIFPRLTGREHIDLAARLHRAGRTPDETEDLIEMLGLMEVIDIPAAAYSHGQSRRLSLAMALVPNPPVLLVDEPFDGVDPEGVDTITQLLVDARARGAATVLTTHLLDAAVIVDDVAVFHHHSLVGPFPTAELLSTHGSLRQAWSDLSHAVPT